MADLYNKYLNNTDLIKLQNGIRCKDIFLYSKDTYLLIVKDDIRMFKASFKRLKKTFNLSLENILSIIVNNIDNIRLYNDPTNTIKYFLIINQNNINSILTFTYHIKLKEIDEYLNLTNNNDFNKIISKQNEKINLLLKKIEFYKNKYIEPTTDDEFL